MQDIDSCGTTGFWTVAVPSLTLSPWVGPPPEAGMDVAHHTHALEIEGATVVRRAVPSVLCEQLERGVLEARRSFGHEVFALMYDEVWLALFASLPVLNAAMGDGVRAVPMPFVNYVPPGDAGFAPHRDRQHTPLSTDGTPNIMTVWTAVTEATTDRGCLAILPTRFDPAFPDDLGSVRIPDPRDIRSLPVDRGDAVIFNQAILHMGTRNVTSLPRVSIAIEIERAGLHGSREPSIELARGVSFEQRLGLVGTTIGALAHNNIRFHDHELALAKAMTESVHGKRFASLWA
ncbi:MAG: phytanoyl-CoA dioxygenase family protein [Leifsonia sp.]